MMFKEITVIFHIHSLCGTSWQTVMPLMIICHDEYCFELSLSLFGCHHFIDCCFSSTSYKCAHILSKETILSKNVSALFPCCSRWTWAVSKCSYILISGKECRTHHAAVFLISSLLRMCSTVGALMPTCLASSWYDQHLLSAAVPVSSVVLICCWFRPRSFLLILHIVSTIFQGLCSACHDTIQQSIIPTCLMKCTMVLTCSLTPCHLNLVKGSLFLFWNHSLEHFVTTLLHCFALGVWTTGTTKAACRFVTGGGATTYLMTVVAFPVGWKWWPQSIAKIQHPFSGSVPQQ
jgi:hypothetical protein